MGGNRTAIAPPPDSPRPPLPPPPPLPSPPLCPISVCAAGDVVCACRALCVTEVGSGNGGREARVALRCCQAEVAPRAVGRGGKNMYAWGGGGDGGSAEGGRGVDTPPHARHPASVATEREEEARQRRRAVRGAGWRRYAPARRSRLHVGEDTAATSGTFHIQYEGSLIDVVIENKNSYKANNDTRTHTHTPSSTESNSRGTRRVVRPVHNRTSARRQNEQKRRTSKTAWAKGGEKPQRRGGRGREP